MTFKVPKTAGADLLSPTWKWLDNKGSLSIQVNVGLYIVEDVPGYTHLLCKGFVDPCSWIRFPPPAERTTKVKELVQCIGDKIVKALNVEIFASTKETDELLHKLTDAQVYLQGTLVLLWQEKWSLQFLFENLRYVYSHASPNCGA